MPIRLVNGQQDVSQAGNQPPSVMTTNYELRTTNNTFTDIPW